MSELPLNELKRHLSDNTIPLPKRLKLAKNVVQSQHFPTVPKERVVANWVNQLIQENQITSRELKAILDWLNGENDFTNELKHKIIQVVSQYLHGAPLRQDDISIIVLFLTNKKITSQLNYLPENFLFITKTLLQKLQSVRSQNLHEIQTILNNVVIYYKESKKKMEFMTKLIFSDCLEQIYSYLNTECHDAVVNLCGEILFSQSKKQAFYQFFNHIIRTDNVDEIACDRSENMLAVVKVMRGFFTFPNGRMEGEYSFLNDFITSFVTCFRNDSLIIFGFYVMSTTALNMPQNYLIPAMKISPIMFEENNDKIKRKIFLNMLEVLLKNEVDISVRLTDTFGENVSRAEIKKSFMSFLQTLMLGQLKLEGKLDKTTLCIIKTAIKLDPSLVEQKMEVILPHIMTTKKNNADFLARYTEMMNCLLEMLFKLRRGADFLNQMIPHIKLSLEASNVAQAELTQMLNKTDSDVDNIKKKIITGKDIFPQECVVVYGKFTSGLLFRQNKDLLLTLQKNLEENCLIMLKEGFVSPSIETLAEVITSMLASFMDHSKMADHTVPQNVAEEFWTAFQDFEDQCLNKFGKSILKLQYNPSLVLSFLKLCVSFSHLKLLNLKYSNTKLKVIGNNLLPFLGKEKWVAFTSKIQEEKANMLWTQILLVKTMIVEMLSDDATKEQSQNLISETKTMIIKQIYDYPQFLLNNDYLTKNLFRNLDKHQLKQLTKAFMKSYANYSNLKIFTTDAVIYNKELLQALLLRVASYICDRVANVSDLSKALNKAGFDVTSFAKEVDVEKLINCASIINLNEIGDMVEVLKHLQIEFLEENYQLTAILVLLIVKKCCEITQIIRNIDHIIQSIFELSPKYPDLYKLFSINYMFNYENTSLLDLIKFTIKTPNNILIHKSVIETAVKKVKTDPEIIKNIVEILLINHQKRGTITSITYFKEPVFRTICIALLVITKEKRALTTSAYRSILANMQDKLNKSMLESFKTIDFGRTDGPVVTSESTVATLNAMTSYSLLLMKYCETSDVQEFKNMECLLSGLELFVQRAIYTIELPISKPQHLEHSLYLLNIVLRYIKKFETLAMFKNKDELFIKLWNIVKNRLVLMYNPAYDEKIDASCSDKIAVTLKYLAELSSVECFSTHFVNDLANLTLLKKPSIISKNADFANLTLSTRKVSKYLWQSCLKANIIEPKCIALTKLIEKVVKNVRSWIQQHYSCVDGEGETNIVESARSDEDTRLIKHTTLKIEDSICEILRYDLDIVSEVILAAKKITLDFKFIDSVFDLIHLMHFILGREVMKTKCEITWQGFITVYYGCVTILNNLLLSREELLEDRWPSYMQSYKAIVLCLCERSTSKGTMDTDEAYKLADMAHTIEKLTQSICKRKTHVSRISAYAVADFCMWLEKNPPPQVVRQHVENSIFLLIQVSDSTFSMAFIKRALAGTVGQATMANMYAMYKRYHKYVGNA